MLQHERQRTAEKLPNFDIGNHVLVARDVFHAEEKLALRWCGLRRVQKDVSNYVYEIGKRTGAVDDVHISRLKFSRDSDLNQEAIRRHVISSETGMVVARLVSLEETPLGLQVRVRCRGHSASQDTLEPIVNI